MRALQSTRRLVQRSSLNQIASFSSIGHHGIPRADSVTPPDSSPLDQPLPYLQPNVPKYSLPQSQALSDITRPGGRQSVSGVVATVFGASGFLGRYTVNHLGRIGSQVIAPYRGDGMNMRHLKLNGDLGQIVLMPYSIFDEASIRKTVSLSNVCINFIGSRFETTNYSYKDVNVSIPYRLAKIAKEAGVDRFIHISCYGAAQDSPSAYFRSKWEGEQAVRSIYPDATIIRPTPAFGNEDRFLNYIATMGEKLMALPVTRDGQQKLAPIFSSDTARAVLSAVMYESTIGQTYEIAGPHTYTMEELVKLVNASAYSDIKLFPMPDFAAKIYGRALEGLKLSRPDPTGKYAQITSPLVSLVNRLGAPTIYNSDMVAQASVDMVPSGELPGLADLGVPATSLLAVLDELMIPHRAEGVAPERFQDPEKIREAAIPAGVEDVMKRRTTRYETGL